MFSGELPYKGHLKHSHLDGTGLPRPVQPEDFILMAEFYVYGDDSGKYEQPKDEYTALCGYVAHTSEWGRFAQEWNNARMRWQVPPIHMSAIMFPQRDKEWQAVRDKWGKTWDITRDMMLKDFATILLSAQIACVGAVVDSTHFRSLPDSEFKRRNRDTLYLAFHQLVMRGIEKTEVIDTCSPIGVVIDDGRDSSLRYYEMLHILKDTFPKVKVRVSSISFVNDKSYPGIQASDMVTYESRKLMWQRKADRTLQASELYGSATLLGLHQPLLYTPEVLDMLNSMPYEGETSDESKLGSGQVRRDGAENTDSKP